LSSRFAFAPIFAIVAREIIVSGGKITTILSGGTFAPNSAIPALDIKRRVTDIKAAINKDARGAIAAFTARSTRPALAPKEIIGKAITLDHEVLGLNRGMALFPILALPAS
jgi:hypothetical protein